MDWMKDDGLFIPMINDTGRNRFYQQALQDTCSGKTVCEIGSGTGFLSVMAVEAGASHVTAVERDADRCALIRQLVDRAGMNTKIEIIHDDFLNTKIVADIYVSETINTQIFGENIIELSNHVMGLGGRFVPAGFRIWIEAYEDHPIFVLDLSNNESCKFDPGIQINDNFQQTINQKFLEQYDLQQTVYKANQLNRLFPMLSRFDDLKIKKIASTDPVTVDLNQINRASDIQISMPFHSFQDNPNPLLVLRWQAYCGQIYLNDDQCWFGNVAKPIRQRFRTRDHVTFSYDPGITNWRVIY